MNKNSSNMNDKTSKRCQELLIVNHEHLNGMKERCKPGRAEELGR